MNTGFDGKGEFIGFESIKTFNQKHFAIQGD